VEERYVAFKEAIDKKNTEEEDGEFAGRKEMTAADLKKINSHKGLHL